MAQFLQSNSRLPPLEMSGWFNNGDIEWIEKAFPEEIEDLLLSDESEYEDGSDE